MLELTKKRKKKKKANVEIQPVNSFSSAISTNRVEVPFVLLKTGLVLCIALIVG